MITTIRHPYYTIRYSHPKLPCTALYHTNSNVPYHDHPGITSNLHASIRAPHPLYTPHPPYTPNLQPTHPIPMHNTHPTHRHPGTASTPIPAKPYRRWARPTYSPGPCETSRPRIPRFDRSARVSRRVVPLYLMEREYHCYYVIGYKIHILYVYIHI